MFITWIAKIVAALNSNTRPRQIAAAIALALLLALIPKTTPGIPPVNLLWVSIFIFTFFIKINQAVELVFLAIFDLIALLLDPLLHLLGYTVLTLPALHDFFTTLYNVPLLYFFKFYNTVVMGGLIAGIVLFVPMYLLARWGVNVYRDKIREKIAHSKLVKAFQKNPLVMAIKNTFGKAYNFYANLR
jgi:uncharacterized protein (TIGR03546 family)